MPNPVQIKDFPHIHSGATPASQTKLTDLLVIEHMDAPSSTDKTLKMMIGQLLCKPVFTVASQQSGNGRYSATCQNYAGFSLFYTDSQNARHYFIGLPIKVIFTPACNYGSVSGNTYPTISFNGSDFIPILANGKTVASGAWQAGQSLEGCIIQTILNGATVYAFDLNSNIRQQDSNSTIYSDGRIEYNNSKVTHALSFMADGGDAIPQTEEYLQVKKEGNKYTYDYIVSIGETTGTPVIYIRNDSLNPASYRPIGYLTAISSNDTKHYTIQPIGNTSAWLFDAAGNRVRMNDISGKRFMVHIEYYPVS